MGFYELEHYPEQNSNHEELPLVGPSKVAPQFGQLLPASWMLGPQEVAPKEFSFHSQKQPQNICEPGFRGCLD